MQYDEIKELIAIFEKTDLNDMDIQLDNARIRLNRGAVPSWAAMPPAPPAPPASPAMPSASPAVPPASVVESNAVQESMQQPVSTENIEKKASESDGTQVIKAPIVGTFYQSSAPEEPPFVSVGDTVAKGDVVCIIEAMKFMNEVNSEVSGTITEVLVKDGDFVEYGQELFRVK